MAEIYSPPPVFGSIGSGLWLDGSSSHDQDIFGNTDPNDNGITSYAWTYGAAGASGGTGSSFSLSGSALAALFGGAGGSLTVTLTVTDNEGETDTESITLTIGSTGSTLPPVAVITNSSSGAGLSLDGSASEDQDMIGNTGPFDTGITAYAWSGVYQGLTLSGTGPAFDLSASLAALGLQNPVGDLTVTLTVTDNDQETDTEQVTLHFGSSLTPVAAHPARN